MTRDSKQTQRDGESALSRWSRRKLESRQQVPEQDSPDATEQAQPVTGTDEASIAPAAEEEKPVLTDADMPNIDSLDENSDFSPFMSSGVSDELRNLALRKLFRAPVFNIRDGLDEYDGDYTSFEKLGDIVTSDMKHRIEMEELKLREKLAEEQRAADELEAESAQAEAVEDLDDEDEAESESDTDRLARLDAEPGHPVQQQDESEDEQ